MAGVKRAVKARVRQPAEAVASMVPEECSQFVQQRVLEALPLICESLLGKAKEGDSTALKTLWQMAGLAKAGMPAVGSTDEDADRRGAAFARAALKRLSKSSRSDATRCESA